MIKQHNGSDHRAGTAGTSDHPFQKHAQARLRVHHIDTHHGLSGQAKSFHYSRAVKIRHPLPVAAARKTSPKGAPMLG